ncbi:hypothetical protein [Gilliamella apicola]
MKKMTEHQIISILKEAENLKLKLMVVELSLKAQLQKEFIKKL